MANILHVNHRFWPVIGGSEQSVLEIARRQAASGHSVTVLTTNADDFSAFWDPEAARLPAGTELHLGLTIVRTPIATPPGKLWGFAAIRRLQTYFELIAAPLSRRVPSLPQLDNDLSALGSAWDLVVDWNITFDGMAAAAREMANRSDSRFITVPFLHLGEGPESPVRRYYTMPHQLALLRSADKVIVQTEVARSFLMDSGVKEESLATVGLGIDPNSLSGGDANRFRQQYGIEDPIVTAIGPLTHDKGSQHLVDAIAILREQGQVARLVLAGPPMVDFERYWANQPEDVKKQVLRLGSIQGPEKLDLLAATNLLALPSRTDSFGIVLLEAWFYGKPVIGAKAGGIPGLIENGVDGRLVPFADPEALAAAVNEIIDDPDKANRWGESGRKKVLDRYTWDAVYERFSGAIGVS